METTSTTRRPANDASLGKSIEISRPGFHGETAARYGSELWLSGAAELDAVREVTTVKGQRWCLLWALPGKQRTVERTQLPDGTRRARMRNGAPCGSSRCPNCARRMRLRKSVEVEGLLNALMTTPVTHTDEHGFRWTCTDADGDPVARQLYMVTLTARHKRSDSLDQTLATIEGAFRKLWSGRNGERWRVSGLRLVVKSLEVTYGDNGWHPHLHVIVAGQPMFGLPAHLFSGLAFAAEFEQMRAVWLRSVGLADAVARGRVEASVPFAVEDVSPGALGDLSDYVSGLSGARGAALEATRLDLKRSDKGNISVWELPSKLAQTRHNRATRATVGNRELSHAQLARRWREWEQTMRGVHQLAFAPGWREFMPPLAEVEDRVQELRDAADAGSEWVVVYTPDERECALMARYGLAPVLSAAATDGAAGVAFVLAQYALRAQRAAEARNLSGEDWHGGEHAPEATTDDERATPPGGASEAEGGAVGAAQQAAQAAMGGSIE